MKRVLMMADWRLRNRSALRYHNRYDCGQAVGRGRSGTLPDFVEVDLLSGGLVRLGDPEDTKVAVQPCASCAGTTRPDFTLARCASSDLDFFPEDETDTTAQVALCGECPIVSECLAYALAYGMTENGTGIWGGTTPPERRRTKGRT